MTCADCSQARAGSLPAFDALHPQGTGERKPLRDTIRRAMPNTDPAEARRMVWAWWLHDHPAQRPAP